MTAVATFIQRLEAVGRPSSEVLVWADLCKRSVGDVYTDIHDPENEVFVNLTLNSTDRQRVLQHFAAVDNDAEIIVWIAGCKRTFGVVSYDELDDTITIRTEIA